MSDFWWALKWAVSQRVETGLVLEWAKQKERMVPKWALEEKWRAGEMAVMERVFPRETVMVLERVVVIFLVVPRELTMVLESLPSLAYAVLVFLVVVQSLHEVQ
jgi:hypothetical protein